MELYLKNTDFVLKTCIDRYSGLFFYKLEDINKFSSVCGKP